MASRLIVAGLGIAAVGYGVRWGYRYIIHAQRLMERQLASTKYYKGGFEPAMTRREASLILGISPSSSKERVKAAHKRLMIINHPDRGGSPYLATKINEARDKLESNKA